MYDDDDGNGAPPSAKHMAIAHGCCNHGSKKGSHSQKIRRGVTYILMLTLKGRVRVKDDHLTLE